MMHLTMRYRLAVANLELGLRWLHDRARTTWTEPHHTRDPELWWLTNGRYRKSRECLILARLELGLRWLHDRAQDRDRIIRRIFGRDPSGRWA